MLERYTKAVELSYLARKSGQSLQRMSFKLLGGENTES